MSLMGKIASILQISEQGITRPYICADENGGIRWCKGNHTGFRSVISEWICARLARELELPIPDFAILKLDLSLFNEWCRYRTAPPPEIVTAANQFVFASLNVSNCKDVMEPKEDLAHIDKTLLARIYLFDQIIQNTDRTSWNSNLLVNGNIYIIDHNNAFDPLFSTSAFAEEHVLREFKDAICKEEKTRIRHAVAELAAGTFLDEIWSEIPDAWADAGSEVLALSQIREILMDNAHE